MLRLVVLLDQFINVNVEFEELLPNEVFNELVVIDELLIVDLRSAFQFHFLGVVLPLDLYLHECAAHKLQHFVWITEELHAHVIRALLLHLNVKLALVTPRIDTEWIFDISVL